MQSIEDVCGKSNGICGALRHISAVVWRTYVLARSTPFFLCIRVLRGWSRARRGIARSRGNSRARKDKGRRGR